MVWVLAAAGVTTTGGSAPSLGMQELGIWAAVVAALGVVAGLVVWAVRSTRSHLGAWSIDYTDANLAGSLGTEMQIAVGAETDVRIRIRVNTPRAIIFEELGVHLRERFHRRLLRRWLFHLPEENLGDVVEIIDLADPEPDQYLQDEPGRGWPRTFRTIPSRDHRGIWRGFFEPPYLRGKHEPLFLRVRIRANQPWKGYLFVRLLNDRNERAFHPLGLEAAESQD